MSEKAKKKQMLMREYFKREGAPDVIGYKEAQERLENCKYCEGFKDAEYLHCLHCGRALR